MEEKVRFIKPATEKAKRRNKKSKLPRVIGFILLAVFIIAIIAGIVFVVSKLDMIRGTALNQDDLDINKDIFNEVSDTISKDEFNNIKSIAIFGKDEGRTDTIVIASINPKTKSISLISIPRDTYVNVPGYGKTKINHAYAYGKEQLTIKTINNNFDLNISEYVTIDFVGFIHIINAIGGIEMDITKEEMKYINDRVFTSHEISKKYPIKKLTTYGKITLTGEQALTHSRNRTVGNDFTRAERQRNVINAVIAKAGTLDFNKLLSLADSMLSEVKTNINITNYISLATSLFAQKNSYLSNVQSVQVPSTSYSEGKTIDGVYYFVPDYEKSKQDFIKYIYGKDEVKNEEN